MTIERGTMRLVPPARITPRVRNRAEPPPHVQPQAAPSSPGPRSTPCGESYTALDHLHGRAGRLLEHGGAAGALFDLEDVVGAAERGDGLGEEEERREDQAERGDGLDGVDDRVDDILTEARRRRRGGGDEAEEARRRRRDGGGGGECRTA